ncbi:MAG: CoA-binding protein [Deltaproteobacteria bacterium]|nr:CoA-binding protein [Deltaproteobacteria bacterium]MBW1918804.1 CoA-binding protein [Deltaproteobacteria bacterium]MBW1935164.1 CoA-binding protein [Deltaproteobacteria bacterium]MBW1977396.1 CoA-binding protein [Deltaproteobacteria bacterium]MBW2044050.1 CoA-binding protein [Deltaproteobacteria bacterium]
MAEAFEKNPLFPIANPRSICFFGVSSSPFSMGTNLLISLRAMGFRGSIYPIHPQIKDIQGLRVYPSVMDVPQVPDLAVIVLAAPIVPQVLEECGRKGIRHAIIVSGGFKEVGEKGVLLEKRILEIARRYGIRFLGPNCIGVINPGHKLNTTLISYTGAPGFIGMASQSGSFVTQMFGHLFRLRLGFSTAFSVGNEANVDLVDCLTYLGTCPNTKVIALYVEDIKRGREFTRTAKKIALQKPIVAYYVGGSETGKRAGFSHTGAMAGPDELYSGAFQQSGVIRATSVIELFDFCWILGTMPPAIGPRVVIQTHSGGPGAAAADACGRAGLELPELSKETLEKLAPFLPPTGSARNPIDFTYTKNPLDYFSKIPEVLIQEKNADMLLLYLLLPSQILKRNLEQMGLSEDQIREQAKQLVDTQSGYLINLQKQCKKPLIGYTFQSTDEEYIQAVLDKGLPVLPDAVRAARALKALVRYTRWRQNTLKHSGT